MRSLLHTGIIGNTTKASASNADLLDVAYNTDITGYITAFDSILGDAYLDTAMASEPHRSSARMASAMAGGDPFLHADALTGTSLLWEEDPFGYWDTTLHTHTFSLAEHDIYGSSRLGVRDYFGTQVGLSWNYTAAIYDTVRLWQRLPWYSFEYQDVINDTARSIYGNTLTQKYITQFMRGQKQYELTDHLGDVLATVSDARMPNDTVALHTTGFYQPVEQSQFDYYPFGQYLTGRCLPDTEMHCAVTTETQLVAVTTTTFVPWYYPISPNPYVIVGQGTLQQVGEGGLGGGVIFTGSTEAAELEYSLGTEPAGVPLEVDLDIALSTGSFTAMLVDASNKALATVSVSASQQQAVYRLTATPLSTGTLHIVYCCSGLIPWHEVTYGHWITTTTWETETVVSDVCSEDKYHYGFNGKLKDNQWAGPGNSYDYGARMEDTRIARFRSADPLSEKYPWYTPYQFAGNKPLWSIDVDGLEEYHAIDGSKIGNYGTSTEVRVVYQTYVPLAQKLTNANTARQFENPAAANDLLYRFGSAPVFTDEDDAAKNWGMEINGTSIVANKEFASIIFMTKINDKRLISYTQPIPGDQSTSSSSFDLNTARMLAYIHSHGGYAAPSDDDFSSGGHYTDLSSYLRQKINVAYVATPNGSLRKWMSTSPTQSQIISTGLPSDANDNSRYNPVVNPSSQSGFLHPMQTSGDSKRADRLEKKWVKDNQKILQQAQEPATTH